MIEWDRQGGMGERGEDHRHESNPGRCGQEWAMVLARLGEPLGRPTGGLLDISSRGQRWHVALNLDGVIYSARTLRSSFSQCNPAERGLKWLFVTMPLSHTSEWSGRNGLLSKDLTCAIFQFQIGLVISTAERDTSVWAIIDVCTLVYLFQGYSIASASGELTRIKW